MPEGPPPDDLQGPAERRLSEHLELVRTSPLPAESGLAAGIVRRAGWQRLVRAPLDALGNLIAAVADALMIFAGQRKREPEQRK